MRRPFLWKSFRKHEGAPLRHDQVQVDFTFRRPGVKQTLRLDA